MARPVPNCQRRNKEPPNFSGAKSRAEMFEQQCEGLLCEVLQCLERTNLDDLAGGLGLEDLFELRERVNSFSSLRGRLMDDDDFQQPRNSECAWAFLSNCELDLVAQGRKYRLHLFAGQRGAFCDFGDDFALCGGLGGSGHDVLSPFIEGNTVRDLPNVAAFRALGNPAV